MLSAVTDALDDAAGVREVKSAARTVELLELLAARRNRPARLRELSEALGVPRSSLHALLRTLVKYGWVRVDSSGSLYGIGIRALLAGTSYLDTDPFLPLVLPFLEELREKVDETFHFGRLDGTDVVYLATRESSQYLRPYSRIGRRLPAYSTALGKSLLAERPSLDGHLPDTMERSRRTPSPPGPRSTRSWSAPASAATPSTSRRTAWGCAATRSRCPTPIRRRTRSASPSRWPASPRSVSWRSST